MRPAGTLTSVAAINRAALVDWHRQRLTKENLLLVVVGNVSREDLTSKIAASFGKLPAKGGSARAIVALKPITPDVIVVKRDLPTNYITGYYSAPPPSDRDFAAFAGRERHPVRPAIRGGADKAQSHLRRRMRG